MGWHRGDLALKAIKKTLTFIYWEMQPANISLRTRSSFYTLSFTCAFATLYNDMCACVCLYVGESHKPHTHTHTFEW